MKGRLCVAIRIIMSAHDADVIVVGSGAGGSLTAYGLAMAGVKVLLLEMGPRFDPAKDYFLNDADWELKNPFQKYIPDTYTSPMKQIDDQYFHLSSSVLQRAPNRREFDYFRACGVGGTTLRYQGEAHRFPPHAFRMKTVHGIAEDWPVSYADLDPYYLKVETLLGVAGNPHALFPRSAPFPNPAHPLSCASSRVAEGCRKLGMTLSENTLAILSRPSNTRPACIYCKLCSLGCMVGDKGSADVAVLPIAEKTGKLKIQPNSVAVKIITGRKGRAEGLIVADRLTGKQTHVKSRAVVLAAGAIETPRLLLNSANKEFPQGLCNRNALVGTHLMENLEVGVLFVFPRKLKSYQGVSIDSKVWDFMVPDPVKGRERPFTLSSCGAPDGVIGPASFAMKVAKGFGKKHRQFVEKYYGAHAMVFGIAEQLPRSSNKVMLDPEEKDDYGMPKALVDVALDDADHKALDVMLDLCRELAKASGAEKLLGHYTTYDVSSATHVCGTARMGSDPKTSVVDSWGRSHAIRNLFIADASVLVTQGCGASPSLTIQALALRTADHITSALKKGLV